jgi:sporulation protein YlmC with PRC-barrel domain
MSAFQRVKIVSQLLDLPIIDKDERSCGIVDDVELSGRAGKEMRVEALLVGPGAYEGRMPKWMYWLVRKTFGDRMARVPAGEVVEIGAVVKLKSRAEDLKLHVVEDEVRAWIPQVGAL